MLFASMTMRVGLVSPAARNAIGAVPPSPEATSGDSVSAAELSAGTGESTLESAPPASPPSASGDAPSSADPASGPASGNSAAAPGAAAAAGGCADDRQRSGATSGARAFTEIGAYGRKKRCLHDLPCREKIADAAPR